jgi:hypothetical protein
MATITNGKPKVKRKPQPKPRKTAAAAAEENTPARESLLRWCLFARGVLEHLARDAHDLLTSARDEDHPLYEFLHDDTDALEEIRDSCSDAACRLMDCEPYPVPSITIPDPFEYSDGDEEDEDDDSVGDQ